MSQGHTVAEEGGADYRVVLANERTFLAWTRTALAAAAASLAVTHLAREGSPVVRVALALLLAVGALVAAGWSGWRWRAVEQATRSGRPIPSRIAPWVVVAVGVSAALGTALVAVTG